MNVIIKEAVTVWKDSTDNQPLLEQKGDGQYYVPLAFIKADKLNRLCLACACAIKDAAPSQTAPLNTLPLPAALQPDLN